MFRYEVDAVSKAKFFEILEQEWLPALERDGFSGISLTGLRKIGPHAVSCISVQPSSNRIACFINMGICFVFQPDVWGKRDDPLSVEEACCSVRKRLTRGNLGFDDLWYYCQRPIWIFRCSEKYACSSARALIKEFDRSGRAFFNQYEDLPHQFDSISLDDVRRGRIPAFLPKYDALSVANLLAHWHRETGSRSRSGEFAALGLALLKERVDSGEWSERHSRPLRRQLEELESKGRMR
jgi:hypothetical protein